VCVFVCVCVCVCVCVLRLGFHCDPEAETLCIKLKQANGTNVSTIYFNEPFILTREADIGPQIAKNHFFERGRFFLSKISSDW
jgi:hypothetical protein